MASIPPATSSRNLVEVGDELSLERDELSLERDELSLERDHVSSKKEWRRGKTNGKNEREKRPDPHSLKRPDPHSLRGRNC